jgi:hypothetical protein
MPEKTAAQLVGVDSLGDEAIAELSRRASLLTYKQARTMRRDPTIALGRWLVAAPIIASAWSVEEKENAPEGAKEEIDKVMQPLRTHVLRNVMMGWLDYGWQGFEKILDVGNNGLLYPRKLKPLLPDITGITVETATGQFAGFTNGTVELSIEESLLFTFEPEGTDWYGTPILENSRSAWEQWNTLEVAAKRYDIKIAGTHLIVRFPDDGEGVNSALCDKLIKGWQASGAIGIPVYSEASNDGKWDVQLLSDNSAGRGQFVERHMYLDKLKVRGLGLPERAVLEGEYGTKADAEAHADFAILNLELRHQDICQTINWHLVNQLLRLNYGAQFENTVVIKPSPITDQSKKFLRSIYTEWIKSPDGALLESAKLDLDALRDALDVPSIADDQVEDVLPGPTTPSTPAPSTGGVTAETTLNGAQITSAMAVVQGMTNKSIGRIAGMELLVAVGIPRDKAQSMADEAQPLAAAPVAVPITPVV